MTRKCEIAYWFQIVLVEVVSGYPDLPVRTHVIRQFTSHCFPTHGQAVEWGRTHLQSPYRRFLDEDALSILERENKKENGFTVERQLVRLQPGRSTIGNPVDTSRELRLIRKRGSTHKRKRS